MKLFLSLFLSAFLFSFNVYAMDAPYDIIEHVYDYKITYSPGVFNYYRDGSTLSAPPCLPQKAQNQKAYSAGPKEFKESALYKETSLYKVIPGQDARNRISNTITWPHCINTKLTMIVSGQEWGGSGTMVGPHHVLTCGHCVYDHEEKKWFDEIFAYPALNGELAPFGKLRVTKAYILKNWLKGDANFDIALLLLDQSIGEYTGWGGILSASDEELFSEEIHITGYPGDGDKGFKQMWGMGHKIKTMTSEKVFYEHDTQGGQSGCAISIKKYGMTFIVGVHTNGCGLEQKDVDSMPRNTPLYNALVNSGVRISETKFRNFFLKIIDTGTLQTFLPVPASPLRSFVRVQQLSDIRSNNPYKLENKWHKDKGEHSSLDAEDERVYLTSYDNDYTSWYLSPRANGSFKLENKYYRDRGKPSSLDAEGERVYLTSYDNEYTSWYLSPHANGSFKLENKYYRDRGEPSSLDAEGERVYLTSYDNKYTSWYLSYLSD